MKRTLPPSTIPVPLATAVLGACVAQKRPSMALSEALPWGC